MSPDIERLELPTDDVGLVIENQDEILVPKSAYCDLILNVSMQADPEHPIVQQVKSEPQWDEVVSPQTPKPKALNPKPGTQTPISTLISYKFQNRNPHPVDKV